MVISLTNRLLPATTRPRAFLTAISVLLTGLAVAACGSSSSRLDTASVAQAIEKSMLAQKGITTRVTCPSAPKRKGYAFVCSAELAVGVYAVNVTEADAAGHVTYSNSAPLNLLDYHSVVAAIERSIRRQSHVTATVTCPHQILQAKGLKFLCLAVSPKRRGTFTVTEVDARGDVRFVGN